MKTDLDTLQEKNREHLRQALAAGIYTTERDSMFSKLYWPAIDALGGEKLMVEQGTECQPIRATENALLVRVTDKKHRHWFAWIHA